MSNDTINWLLHVEHLNDIITSIYALVSKAVCCSVSFCIRKISPVVMIMIINSAQTPIPGFSDSACLTMSLLFLRSLASSLANSRIKFISLSLRAAASIVDARATTMATMHWTLPIIFLLKNTKNACLVSFYRKGTVTAE